MKLSWRPKQSGFSVGVGVRERGGVNRRILDVAEPERSERHRWAWATCSPMPTARTAAIAVTLNNEVWVMGGMDTMGHTLDSVEIYSPATDQWRVGPSLPHGRHHAAALVSAEKVYVMGGYQSSGFILSDDVFVFDRARREWSRGPTLPAPRAAHAALFLHNTVYVLGGMTSSGPSSDVLCYRPIEQGGELPRQRELDWSKVTPLPGAGEHLVAGVVHNTIVVTGGRSGGSKAVSGDLFQLSIEEHLINAGVTTEVDRWGKGPVMPTARYGATATVYENVLVVSGGEDERESLNTVEAFDAKVQRWSTLPSLSIPRHDAVSATVGSSIYVIGGGGGSGLSMSHLTERLDFGRER